MTTPGPALEDRVAALETRLDTILPTLATKEDIARLEGKIDASNERLEGKIDASNERLEGKMDASNERIEGKFDTVNKRIDAIEYRMLIKLTSAMAAIVAIGVAALKFL